ncbi:MAG: hypothetical protein SOZ01_05180 [Selenomonadaceae bacterium]|nr:hypothetical protein [Selenomonadaceae bacterium]MDD7056267.1 hypothetical protein [Selenomonadaceae bacterium]MDY3916118.1 hypothetical protein [Selenomonadaceae bacterium]
MPKDLMQLLTTTLTLSGRFLVWHVLFGCCLYATYYGKALANHAVALGQYVFIKPGTWHDGLCQILIMGVTEKC